MIPISVIIPTYNRSSIVSDAINSVITQTEPATEIIVVDDGSQDDTSKVLESFGNAIRVIKQPNSGLSGARNTGIKAARSPWVAFLDDDDEFAPRRLEIVRRNIESFPAALVHGTNAVLISPDREPVDLFKLRGFTLEKEVVVNSPLPFIISSCFFTQSMVIKRDTLFDVGLFRKVAYEDLDIFIRLSRCTPWVINPSQMVRIIRRTQPEVTLSGALRANPIWSYEDLVRIHREALSIENLTSYETQQIKGRLATNLFNLGEALIATGDSARARATFFEAARLFPKWHSRVKSLAAAVFGRFAIVPLQMLRKPQQAPR